jgi:alpha-L-fucosidase
MNINGSKTQEYHTKNFGDMDYLGFIPMFNKEINSWSPSNMAKIFKKIGAKYVVLTTKHHDGITLWPSRIPNNNREKTPKISRDIVGELSRHVKNNDMKMGLYYSGFKI